MTPSGSPPAIGVTAGPAPIVRNVSEDKSQIADLARAIEHYLEAHPAAADTSEGIARWWLERQRVEHALSQVDEALDLLLRGGRVTRCRAGNAMVYRRAGNDDEE